MYYMCVLYHMHIVTPKTNGLEELEAAGAWWISCSFSAQERDLLVNNR